MPRNAAAYALPYTGLRDQAKVIIQAALADLPARNGHHEFEQLAYRIVQARIAPNVMLPTGPVSAGGDAARDGETYWVVADDFDRSSFALSPAEGIVVGVTTTAKERLSAKIRKDVARCCQDGGVRRIIYFVSESLPDGRRRAIVDTIQRTHGVPIDIYDRVKTAAELSSEDLFAVAVSWLHIPDSLLPTGLPLDRLHTQSRIEAEVAEPVWANAPTGSSHPFRARSPRSSQRWPATTGGPTRSTSSATGWQRSRCAAALPCA